MDIKIGDWVVLDIDYMENDGWYMGGLDSSPFKIINFFLDNRFVIIDKEGHRRNITKECIMYIDDIEIEEGDRIILDLDQMEEDGCNMSGFNDISYEVVTVFNNSACLVLDTEHDKRLVPEKYIVGTSKKTTKTMKMKKENIAKKITDGEGTAECKKGYMVSLNLSDMVRKGHYCDTGLSEEKFYEIVRVHETIITILDDDYDERAIEIKYIKEVIPPLEITGEPLEELKLTEDLIKTEEESLEIDDVINPDHYKQGKYEVIDMIESIAGEQFEGYLVGNIIKYVSRYKYKNGLEDLRKAEWYLEKLIETLK